MFSVKKKSRLHCTHTVFLGLAPVSSTDGGGGSDNESECVYVRERDTE